VIIGILKLCKEITEKQLPNLAVKRSNFNTLPKMNQNQPIFTFFLAGWSVYVCVPLHTLDGWSESSFSSF